MADHEVHQLTAFLKKDARVDLKVSALSYVLGLTGSPNGLDCIYAHKEILLPALVELTEDELNAIADDSYLALVNIAANSRLARELVLLHVTPKLLTSLLDPKCTNHVTMIMSNITRENEGSKAVLNVLQSDNSKIKLHQLVGLFCTNRTTKFHYLATVFSNISQLSSGRRLFLDPQHCLLPKLLPFINYQGSLVRRGGIVGLVRNLCFETDSHQWLLGGDVDILPYLLLPLAGPEELSEEEMEGLPEDLQYLGDDKMREDDPDIRKMLIESVMQLCSTREGRVFIKEKQTYVIMRELHKWEKDSEVSITCQKCIEMLIADEPEPGMHNLHEVNLPENFKSQ